VHDRCAIFSFIQYFALLNHVLSFIYRYRGKYIILAYSSASSCLPHFHAIRLFTPSFGTSSAETATAQLSMLNVTPISFFFTSLRSKTQKVVSCSLVVLLFYGDIHLNPGPGTNIFQVCPVNIHSSSIHFNSLLLLISLSLITLITSAPTSMHFNTLLLLISLLNVEQINEHFFINTYKIIEI